MPGEALTQQLAAMGSLIKQLRAQLGDLRIVRGVVNVTGAGATVLEGEGFSVVRNGAGDVSITFTTPFSARPAVVAMPIGTAARDVGESNLSPATGSDIRLFSVTSAGGSADSPFHFIAAGPA